MDTSTLVIIGLIIFVVVVGLVILLLNINKRDVKGEEAISITHGLSKQESKTSALSYVDHEQLTSNMSTASNFKYQENQPQPIKSVNSQDWVNSKQAQQAIAVHEQQQEQDKQLARQRPAMQGRNAKKASATRSETSEFRSTLDKHPKAAKSFLNQRMSGKGKQTAIEPTYVEPSAQNSQDLVKDKMHSSKIEVFNMMKTRKPESELPLTAERQNAPETQAAQSRKTTSPVQRVKVPNPAQAQARMRGMQPAGASGATSVSAANAAATVRSTGTAVPATAAPQMTLNDYTPNPDYVASHQATAPAGSFAFNAPDVAPQVAVQGGKENYLHSTSLNQGGFVKGLSEGDFDSLVGKPANVAQPVVNPLKAQAKATQARPATMASEAVATSETASSPSVQTEIAGAALGASPATTATGTQGNAAASATPQLDLSNLTPESLAAILAQTNLTQAYRNVNGSVPLNDQFLKSTVIPEGVQQEKLQQANIFAHIETDPVIRQLNGLFQNEAHGYHIFKLEPSRSPYLSKEILVNLFSNAYQTDGLTFVQDVDHACYRLQFKNMEARKNQTLFFVFLDKGQFTAENLAREIEYLILYIPKRYFEREQDSILTYLLTRLVSLRGRLSGELTLHGRRIDAATMYTTSTMRRAVQNIIENKQ